MIKFFKNLIFVLISLFYFSDRATSETIVMGVSASYPPFVFVDKGRIVGFNVDLLNLITQKMGYDLEIKDMDFKDLLPGLKSGKINIATGIAHTHAKAADIDFSIKYHNSKFVILHKKHVDHGKTSTQNDSDKNDNAIESLDDLKNKTVFALADSIMEQFLIVYVRPNIRTTIKTFTMHEMSNVLRGLNSGAADAILVEDITARLLRDGDSTLNTEQLDTSVFVIDKTHNLGHSIALQKNSDLTYHFNNIILELKISNEIEELKKKWGI